jgi:hypothetical protein
MPWFVIYVTFFIISFLNLYLGNCSNFCFFFFGVSLLINVGGE